MDVLQSRHYARVKNYLTVYGHWPFMKTASKIRNQILIIPIILSTAVPQTAKPIELLSHFNLFVLCIPSMMYYWMVLAKNLFAYLKRNVIRRMLEKVQRDFSSFTDEELEIINTYATKASRFNKLYEIYMFSTVIAYSLSPLSLYIMDIIVPLNESRFLYKPRMMSYFIDSLDNNILFMIIHGSITDLLAIILVIGFDTLYLSFSYHTCALFKIVAKRLRGIGDSKYNHNINARYLGKYHDPHYHIIVQAIILHKDAMDLIETIESAFAMLNLWTIGCSMIPLTVTLYEAVVNQDNLQEMVRFLFFAFAEIVHIFYYNWPGQKIRDHSLLVYEACYDGKWYKKDLSIKSKKLLNLVILRSQRSCRLSAGKVYPLDMETFAAVMKVSMSYFTVLLSIT